MAALHARWPTPRFGCVHIPVANTIASSDPPCARRPDAMQEARRLTRGVMGSAVTSQSRTHHQPWHLLGHSVQNLARRIARLPVMLGPKVGRRASQPSPIAGKGGAPCLAQLGAPWSDVCSEMRPHAFGNHERLGWIENRRTPSSAVPLPPRGVRHVRRGIPAVRAP
jgi:hypothetical protein